MSQAPGAPAAVVPQLCVSHRCLRWALRYTEGIQRMLDHYHMLINTLNDAETALLDDHSQELLRVFRSGYKRLNWNSLGNSTAPGLLPVSFTCVSWVGWGVCMQRKVSRALLYHSVLLLGDNLCSQGWLPSELRLCPPLSTMHSLAHVCTRVPGI